MGELLVAVVAVASGAYGLWSGRRRRAKLREEWRAAARECDLTADDETDGQGGLLFRAGALTVRIDAYHRRDEDGTKVDIRSAEHDLLPFTVHGRQAATSYQQHEQVPSGDPGFDAGVIVTGPVPDVLAVLNARTRLVLSSVVLRHALELSFGVLRAYISNASLRDEMHGSSLAEELALVLEAAARLRRKRHPITAMVENAAHDPVPSVRAANLLTLAREHPDDQITGRTLRAACQDPTAEVRLRAAAALAPMADRTLLDVAEEEGAADTWRAQAISALGLRLPYGRAKAILEGALRPHAVETARACVAAVARSGEADAPALLTGVLRSASGEVAAAAARALGEIRAHDAEGPLLESLGRDDPRLRVAAAEALAKVGSAHAVLPLKEAESADARDKALQRAARHAVAEIQARLTGASPGQLSLASAEGGALSLVEDPEGRLSLGAPDTQGRDQAKPRQSSGQ